MLHNRATNLDNEVRPRLSKLERLGILIIVVSLIVFPVSMASLWLEKGGIAWFFLIFLLVSLPRNIAKHYLMEVITK